MLYNIMIKSQSFSGPVSLDVAFTSVFQLSPAFSEAEKLERAGVGEMPFPLSAKSFPLKNGHLQGNALGIFHSDYFSLPPATALRGSFLAFYHKNLVGFLEVKPTEVWTPLRLNPTRDSHSCVSLPSASSDSSHLPFMCPYQFMALALLLQLSRSQL